MSDIYQLKVTLRGSQPPIWRRILVDGSNDLYQLHEVIQIAMGWSDSHLHQFIIDGKHYTPSDPYEMEWAIDEHLFRLEQVVSREKVKFMYEYDFGDCWEHQILAEKIFPPDAQTQYPVCVTGKRACPPEDIGGLWGYEEFLEAINDPHHEQHERYFEWWGEPFDSEAFDLEEINLALRRLK